MVGPDTSKSPPVRSHTQISPSAAEVIRESKPQPDRISQRLEHASHVCGLISVEGRLRDRTAAGLAYRVEHHKLLSHGSRLTDLETGCKLAGIG